MINVGDRVKINYPHAKLHNCVGKIAGIQYLKAVNMHMYYVKINNTIYSFLKSAIVKLHKNKLQKCRPWK